LLKAYPGNLTGHINLSVAYGAIGDCDRAIEQEEFAVQRLKTVITITNLAGSYMDKGLYQKAEDVCRSFLQDVEDNLFVRVHLWASYVCRRQFDLALAEAEKIQFLAPSRKGPKGQVLLFRDDISGAEKILGSDALLLIRGQFNKNVSLRLQNVEKSKGNKGNGAWAYRGLAGALEKAGRYKEALQALNQYLDLSDQNRKSAAESGLLYLPSEQKSNLFIRGRIQAEMKSFDEAQKSAEELKSMIEKGINKKELRYYEYIFGLIELGKKNSRKAAELFDRACGRLDFEGLGDEFNHAMYFDGLARALYESGDLDKARKEYEKITLLTMGRAGHGDIYARAYYMLGKIAEQQGDKPRAIENYRKFLDLWKDADPGLPEVEDAKKRLSDLGT
jgi:tetratricopeptide (TPR) repeat protein